MKNLGILLSGRGSNFEAIARNVEAGRIPARITVVISNREDAAGLARAREMRLVAREACRRRRKRDAGHDVRADANLIERQQALKHRQQRSRFVVRVLAGRHD